MFKMQLKKERLFGMCTQRIKWGYFAGLIKQLCYVAAFAVLVFSGSAFAAAPITIPNFSFESGFDNTGGGVGNWTGANLAGTTGTIRELVPTTGSQMLYANGPDAGGASFAYQKLDILATGKFTFQIDVGTTVSLPASGYDIAFYAVDKSTGEGHAILARETLTAPAPGAWATKTISFSVTGAESWFATDEVQIVLGCGAGTQVIYDNVRGTFTAVP